MAFPLNSQAKRVSGKNE